MPQSATINSLPEAFEVIKAMELQEYDCGEDYRAAGRAALAEILQGQMALRVDRHLALRPSGRRIGAMAVMSASW